jgi:hypothetical protein
LVQRADGLAWVLCHAAPDGAWLARTVSTIDMALLTELFPSPTPYSTEDSVEPPFVWLGREEV